MVNRKALKNEMRQFFGNSKIIQYLEFFLKHRTYRTSYNGEYSDFFI